MGMKLRLRAMDYKTSTGIEKMPAEDLDIKDKRVIGFIVQSPDGNYWLNYYTQESGYGSEERGDIAEPFSEEIEGLTLSQAVKRIQALVG